MIRIVKNPIGDIILALLHFMLAAVAGMFLGYAVIGVVPSDEGAMLLTAIALSGSTYVWTVGAGAKLLPWHDKIMEFAGRQPGAVRWLARVLVFGIGFAATWFVEAVAPGTPLSEADWSFVDWLAPALIVLGLGLFILFFVAGHPDNYREAPSD